MSRRRAANKRKGDAEVFAVDDEDDGEERNVDKRSKVDAAPAASSCSSAAAAAPSSSSAAAASGSSSAAASASRPLAELEKVECVQCKETFECDDAAGHLPRTLPCSHVLCTNCVKAHLNRTPESVLCPEGHGAQKIRIPDGSAAAAMSTVDDWIRLLPPAKELIAAIRNQHHLMTRLGQHGAECSHEGCTAEVTHFCPDCGDLCATHQRKIHALQPFQSHKPKTVAIADKAAFLRDQKQCKIAAPAAKIRSEAAARLLSTQQQFKLQQDELRQLEAQIQSKRKKLEATAKAVGELQRTVDRMRAANDSAVLEMEADRLEAKGQADRPLIDSAVLSALSDELVAALQTFLGKERLLSKAQLVYRASRDGFAATDWWCMCGGKSNLLMLVKVKGNGFVFGAFTPFQWPAGDCAYARSLADPTGTSFLFSLVNDHDRAVKLRLKEDQKAHAGRAVPGYGPVFGFHDVVLVCTWQLATEPDGNYAWPSSYEFDIMADGGAPIKYDNTLLAGDDSKGDSHVYFAAAEIETWQL